MADRGHIALELAVRHLHSRNLENQPSGSTSRGLFERCALDMDHRQHGNSCSSPAAV